MIQILIAGLCVIGAAIVPEEEILRCILANAMFLAVMAAFG